MPWLSLLGVLVAIIPCYVTLYWQKSWQTPLTWQVRLWGIPFRRSQFQTLNVARMHPQVRRYIPWLRRFTHRLGGRLEIGGVSPAWTGQVVTLLLLLPPAWRRLVHIRQKPVGWRSRGWWVLRFSLLELVIFRLWRR